MLTAKVKRPTFESGSKYVTLTATVSKGLVTKVKEFKVLVVREGVTDSQAVVIDLATLTYASSTKNDLEFPALGTNGSTISWKSDKPLVISSTGKVKRPDVGQLAESVTITATATKGVATQTKSFTISVEPWTIQEELDDAASLITWENIRGANTNKSAITTDLVMKTTAGRGVAVTWTTTNTTTCSIAGVITRPSYVTGAISLGLKAVLKHGSSPDEVTKTINITGLTVTPLPMSNEEIVAVVKANLTPNRFLGSTNTSLSRIIDSMVLPVKIDDVEEAAKAVISWSLATSPGHVDLPTSPVIELTPQINSVDATVTRPTKETGNTTLALCSTIRVGEGLDEKTEKVYFDITVLATTV